MTQTTYRLRAHSSTGKPVVFCPTDRIKVTTAFIAETPSHMDKMMGFDYRVFHDIDKEKDYVSDRYDYRYTISTNELVDAEQIDKAGLSHVYDPYVNGQSLSEVFNPRQINPEILPNYEKMLRHIRMGMYNTPDDLYFVDQHGQRLEPHYSVTLNGDGEKFFKQVGEEPPKFLSRQNLVKLSHLVGSFDSQHPYYDVSQSVGDVYMGTMRGTVPDGDKVFVSADDLQEHHAVIAQEKNGYGIRVSP